MAKDYRIISADTHLQIAAERWTPHIPAKYQDQAPRTVRMPDGSDATLIGEKRAIFHGGLSGRPYANRWPNGGHFDTAIGVGSPEQRLEEQDIDGVDGEIMYTYPTGVSYYSGIKDLDAYKATVHAWNEFLAEEYCVVAPERLIGMGMLPDTGVQDAIKELEYCARAGLKGIYLSTYPSAHDMPTPEDDLFWAAALDLDMPVTGHVAFGGFGTGRTNYPFKEGQDPKEVASGVDPFSKFAQYALRGAGNALQMIFTGVFDRFPRLQIYFAETQIGWIPHFLDILDDQYERHMPWADRMGIMKSLDRMPSEYIDEHFQWGFMRNAFGVRSRHDIGIKNIMWATDFPHAESDWPESQAVIEEIFEGVPEDELQQMLSTNAIKYFHLDPAIQSKAKQKAAAAS